MLENIRMFICKGAVGRKSPNNKAFTLIEILLVLAIIAILGAIIVSPFILLNRDQALSGSTLIVKTSLSEARSKTVSGDAGTAFGIHFTEGQSEIVLFEGASYSASSETNRIIPLHKYITIDSVNVSGGGNDIIFGKLLGETGNSGNIILAEEHGGEYQYATVTIFSSGIVE